MAGSLKYFKYVDDQGAAFSINIDESNAEATVGGVPLCVSRTASHPRRPMGHKMRYALAFCNGTPNIRRRFWVGNPLAIPQILASAAFLAQAGTNNNNTAQTAVPWTITRYKGEQVSPVPPLDVLTGDTGLTDGDSARDA
jgi:hypothetical protein